MDTPINPVLPEEKTISRFCQDFCPYVVVLFHSARHQTMKDPSSSTSGLAASLHL